MSDFEPDSDLGKFKPAPEDRVRPIETGGKAAPPAADPLPTQDFIAHPEQAKKDQKTATEMYGDEMNIVKKGEYVDILRKDPTIRQTYVAVGWDMKAFEEEKIDIDLSCFLLDKSNMTRVDEDFIFYNNQSACDGAIKFKEDSRTGAGDGDDETLFIDLNGVPFDVIRIMIVLSIYDDSNTGMNFGMVRNVYLRLVNRDNGVEIARLVIDEKDIAGHTAVHAATLIREGPKWYFEPLVQPTRGGLSAVAKGYGIIVREETE